MNHATHCEFWLRSLSSRLTSDVSSISLSSKKFWTCEAYLRAFRNTRCCLRIFLFQCLCYSKLIKLSWSRLDRWQPGCHKWVLWTCSIICSYDDRAVVLPSGYARVWQQCASFMIDLFGIVIFWVNFRVVAKIYIDFQNVG